MTESYQTDVEYFTVNGTPMFYVNWWNHWEEWGGCQYPNGPNHSLLMFPTWEAFEAAS